MGRKLAIYCEVCGAAKPSGSAEFIVFHRLTFCSPDCRDEYRAADELRREASKKAPGEGRNARAA